MTNVIWFRQDLRISDNLALSEACKDEILPIYIIDSSYGEASQWWTNNSLAKLNKLLDGKLKIYKGSPKEILNLIIEKNDISGVYWNRVYEPSSNDEEVEEMLKSKNIRYQSFNSSLLWEPSSVLKSDNTFYKVFTPFYRKGCLGYGDPRRPINAPTKITFGQNNLESNYTYDAPKWAHKLDTHWNAVGTNAEAKLKHFLSNGIYGYKEGRNFPSKDNVSGLSPHLHFGEVSPNQVWWAVKEKSDIPSNDADHFLSELAWREFSYYLLYHFPDLPNKNFNPKFDNFPWKHDEAAFDKWKHGQTGCPIVDAGMRELWQTGYMHNRVRMIVASFLVKNLMIHWKYGAAWFMNCLVDADLANNSASWQWVAGSGADAAPYFRIFNAVLQGQKFDPDGIYTKKFLPELADMPSKWLFTSNSKEFKEFVKDNNIDYPELMIDLDESRKRALEGFDQIKG